MAIQLLDPDTFLIDLTFNITVRGAAYTQTYRARSAVARQTDDTDIVSQIFTAELSAQANILSGGQYLFLQLHVAESTATLATGRRQAIVETSRSQLHRQ